MDNCFNKTVLIICLFYQQVTFCQSLNIAIDSIVVEEVRHNRFNGCVLAVESNKTFYQKCYGYANYDSKESLTSKTIFDLASLTKLFTASAIELLIQEEKLHYTDSLYKFFPNLSYKNITIHQLLTHTSGLPSYEKLLQEHWNISKVAGNQDVIEVLEKYHPPLLFAPGTQYQYSNTGYVLLASVIEKVSSENYFMFLQQLFFKPLGMENSGCFYSETA